MARRFVVPAAVVLLSILLVATAASRGSLPKIAGDISTLFPTHSPRLKQYRELERYFGGNLVDAIAVNVPEVLDDRTRERLYQLETELGGLDGILRTWSPLLAYSSLRMPFTLRSGGSARFLIEIESDLSGDAREKLNTGVNDAMSSVEELSPARAGPFYVSEEVTKAVSEENHRRAPLCAAVLFTTLAVLFRSIRTAFFVLLVPGIALTWVVLGAALFGIPLNSVTQLVPPLILAVGGAYGVHVAKRLNAATKEQSRAVVQELNRAIGIAALTTAIGFASLQFIYIEAVEEFAVLSSLGVLLSALLALFFLPPLLRIERPQRLWFGQIHQVLHPKLSAFVILLALLVGLGVAKLRVHVDPLDFLPQTSPALQSIEQASARFPGNHLLSLLVTRRDARPLSGSAFEAVEKLRPWLEAQPEIVSVSTWKDFEELESVRSSFSILESPKFGSRASTSVDLKATRVLLETNLEGANLLQLVSELEHELSGRLTELSQTNLQGSFSSLELLMAEQSKIIVFGILESLLVTVLLVAGLLLLLFGSPLLVLVGLIPNVVPLAIVFGSLGWLYGEVNFGAALVATAALSIAVDNTFHLMVVWKARRETAPAPAEAALEDCLPSFLTTALVLVAGFGVLAISDTLPIRQFGILLGASLIVGLLADTTILPTMLGKFSR